VAFLEKSDLKSIYKESKDEATIWREDYPAYERLMNNDLLEGLDPNLPEVNDGSLAAALFKLPKRIVPNKLNGTITSDRDEAWLTELANLQLRNEIIPHANTQAPFKRKWKDAVRKAAGYGSIPLITLFVEREGVRTADFIVALPYDVTLEAGKVSDYDSDVIFWDVYYTKSQLKDMVEQAKAETKKATDSKEEGYNTWYVDELESILNGKQVEERSSLDTPRAQDGQKTKPKGYHFCIAFQRGVDAPFYMYHPGTDKTVREWTNPDPTGDLPVHYLYCYQDFINPYGIGIVKLAGGTQNVLDYMRQADVLATQIGLRPPVAIEGTEEQVDLESIVYAQDAVWFTGGAKVVRQELSDGVYQQLPERIQMYKSSLNNLIPMGDTSVSAAAGDPLQSKTPAGVKMAAANLSIDDEDFKDNFFMTYSVVIKSMINYQFANMEGSDFMKVNDEERQLLLKGGLDFPTDDGGEMSNQVEIQWDTVRAMFDFEVDGEQDKAKDDADKLEGLSKVAELISNPNMAPLMQSGQPIVLGNKSINPGELLAEMIALSTDNDKIITDVTPEEQGGVDPETGEPIQQDEDPNAVDPAVAVPQHNRTRHSSTPMTSINSILLLSSRRSPRRTRVTKQKLKSMKEKPTG
jgi:hypothetical protein